MSQGYQSREVVHGARFESERLASRSEAIHHQPQAALSCRRQRGLEAVSTNPRYRVRRQDQDGAGDEMRLLPGARVSPSVPAFCQSDRCCHHAGHSSRPQLSQARPAVRPVVGRP
jgi:hypothetical protein